MWQQLAGLVQSWAAIVMGMLSGSIPWFTMMILHKKSTLLQKVRVYFLTSQNIFPPKYFNFIFIIFFYFTFILFSSYLIFLFLLHHLPYLLFSPCFSSSPCFLFHNHLRIEFGCNFISHVHVSVNFHLVLKKKKKNNVDSNNFHFFLPTKVLFIII